MARPARTDPVQEHLDSYPYKPRDDEVNAPIVAHMKDEHTAAWGRWMVGDTIGDIQDQHYIEHGKLSSEAELIREIAADNLLRPDHEPGLDCPNSPATCLICQPALDASVARHPAGKKLGK